MIRLRHFCKKTTKGKMTMIRVEFNGEESPSIFLSLDEAEQGVLDGSPPGENVRAIYECDANGDPVHDESRQYNVDWEANLVPAQLSNFDEYPVVDLCFNGWLRNVVVESASLVEGDEHTRVDVSGMSSAELVEKFNKGELLLSLRRCMLTAGAEEVEIHDVEASGK